MGLLGKANINSQIKRWSNILEEYYNGIDPDSFSQFLKKTKKDISWELTLLQMESGLHLALLNVEKGFEILNRIGIRGNDYDTVLKRAKAKITNHELRKLGNEDVSDPVDFYETWATVRKAGYSIDDDIKLPAWVGVINAIRKENERKNN